MRSAPPTRAIAGLLLVLGLGVALVHWASGSGAADAAGAQTARGAVPGTDTVTDLATAGRVARLADLAPGDSPHASTAARAAVAPGTPRDETTADRGRHVSLQARFVDEQGRPAPNALALFVLEAPSGRVAGRLRSDLEGRIHWRLPPRICGEALPPVEAWLEGNTLSVSGPRRLSVDLPPLSPGEGVDLGDLRWELPPLLVSGRAQHHDLRPLQSARVTLQALDSEPLSAPVPFPTRGEALSCRTDAEGRFEIRGYTNPKAGRTVRLTLDSALDSVQRTSRDVVLGAQNLLVLLEPRYFVAGYVIPADPLVLDQGLVLEVVPSQGPSLRSCLGSSVASFRSQLRASTGDVPSARLDVAQGFLSGRDVEAPHVGVATRFSAVGLAPGPVVVRVLLQGGDAPLLEQTLDAADDVEDPSASIELRLPETLRALELELVEDAPRVEVVEIQTDALGEREIQLYAQFPLQARGRDGDWRDVFAHPASKESWRLRLAPEGVPYDLRLSDEGETVLARGVDAPARIRVPPRSP